MRTSSRFCAVIGAFAVAILMVGGRPARANLAKFNTLREGPVSGTTLTNGGITFFNPDNGIPAITPTFVIENASSSFAGDPEVYLAQCCRV